LTGKHPEFKALPPLIVAQLVQVEQWSLSSNSEVCRRRQKTIFQCNRGQALIVIGAKPDILTFIVITFERKDAHQQINLKRKLNQVTHCNFYSGS